MKKKIRICDAYMPWPRLVRLGYLILYMYFLYIFLILTIKWPKTSIGLENSAPLRPSPHQYRNGLKHLDMKSFVSPVTRHDVYEASHS